MTIDYGRFALGMFIGAVVCAIWVCSCAATGRQATPDCGQDFYCVWQLPSGAKELCCPPSHRYCGVKDSDCPEGYCCNFPAKSITKTSRLL